MIYEQIKNHILSRKGIPNIAVSVIVPCAGVISLMTRGCGDYGFGSESFKNYKKLISL